MASRNKTKSRGSQPAPSRPSKTDIYEIADRLWETADELRANSHLKAGEYSVPVLGLIFLKFADSRFGEVETELARMKSTRREVGKSDYELLAFKATLTEEESRALAEGLDEEQLALFDQIYAQKCDIVYQHVFDSYWDDGHSVYELAA